MLSGIQLCLGEGFLLLCVCVLVHVCVTGKKYGRISKELTVQMTAYKALSRSV